MVFSALTVAVPPPQPDPAGPAPAACRALQDALPGTVDGQSRRAVRPRSDLTAAWGSPPVLLRCGVLRPAALAPTSELVVVNGVEWFPEPTGEGYVFTTVRRVADVEVFVPAAYAPEVDPLTDLAAAVGAATPLLPR